MKRVIFLCLLALMFAGLLVTAGCTSTTKKRDANDLTNYPPQSLGVLHLNIVKRYSNVLLPRDISFVFEPATGILKFHHKMLGDNIWVALERNERTLFRQAIEQYLQAFADKNLTQEGAKKKGAFGKIEVLMSWGLFGSAHEAYPVLRFDYQFITPQRPYFILATATTESGDGSNSPAIRIAVSPAQCKDLLAILDEQAYAQLIEELKADHGKFDIAAPDTSPVKDIEGKPEESNNPVKEPEVSFDEF